MAKEIVISVRSELLKVAEQLNQIADASEKVSRDLPNFGKETGNTINQQIRKTSEGLGYLQSLSSFVSKKMGDNFKAMMSVVGVTEGLKLGKVFGDSIKESVDLSNAIRKLANVFDMSKDRFSSFQEKLVKGLGEIGISSESAVSSLNGLSETQVKNEQSLIEYSKAAGELASLGQEKGQEGALVKGVANTLLSMGVDVNNVKEMKGLVEQVRKGYSATGMKPTEILSQMTKIFENMPKDLRKQITPASLVNMSLISKIAGPASTKFLEEYLSKSKIGRMPFEARGFQGVVGKEGLDTEKFKKAAKNIFSMISGDPRMAAKTLGISEEAAEGFVRLYDALDQVDSAQNKVINDNKTLADSYKDAMTLQEAFLSNFNKFKASLAKPIAVTTNWLTDAFQKAFSTSLNDIKGLLPKSTANLLTDQDKLPDALGKNLGATAVVAGAGLLTTVLLGKGIAGIANILKGKVTGLGEKEASEQLFGKATPVYVVNAGEIGQNMGGGGSGSIGIPGAIPSAAGTVALTAGTVSLLAAGGISGFIAGNAIGDRLESSRNERIKEIDIELDKANKEGNKAKVFSLTQEKEGLQSGIFGENGPLMKLWTMETDRNARIKQIDTELARAKNENNKAKVFSLTQEKEGLQSGIFGENSPFLQLFQKMQPNPEDYSTNKKISAPVEISEVSKTSDAIKELKRQSSQPKNAPLFATQTKQTMDVNLFLTGSNLPATKPIARGQSQ